MYVYVCVNPTLLIYPFPPFLFGNQKFGFYVCESVLYVDLCVSCFRLHICDVDFPGGSDGKVSVYSVGDLGWIPGWGRSPGEGNGTPLQYSCLENPMDGGAW